MLPGTADVIAVRISGKITGLDLDTIMDRVDELMSGSEKVHVFVETVGIGGLELGSLLRYMQRAMPLLGKLHRFGRVAVVADQAWMRIGTRLESAMLPSITYRTYMPEEREEAFAWVKGGA
jgi:hypothetical protein